MIKDLAIEQRRRLVGSICGFIERSDWYSQLTPQQRNDLRHKVIDSINTYHDFMLDVLKVSDSGPRNEEALDLLRQIHAGVTGLTRG